MYKKLLGILRSDKNDEESESKVLFVSLLVRAARIDNDYSDLEKLQIDKIVRNKFAVTGARSREIRKLAEELEKNTVDTVQITKEIKKDIPFEKRTALAEDLWSIVLADSIRSDDENSFMRTCIKLIGVNDVDSAKARQSVVNRIKLKNSS